MKELYGQGKALREIAEALKRPQNSIRNKLSELGISSTSLHRSRAKLLSEKDFVIDQWRKGTTAADIAKLLKLSDYLILGLLRGEGFDTSPSSGRYSAARDEIFQGPSLTSEEAYWLGFLYADGSMSRDERTLSLFVQTKDRDVLEKAARFFLRAETDPVSRIKDKSGMSMLRVCSKGLNQRLIRLGMTPNKTYEGVMQIPREFSLDFLRGFLDGDGHIQPKGYHVQLTCSLDSSQKVGAEIEALGMQTRVYHYPESPNVYQVCVSGKAQVASLLGLLYPKGCIAMNRKYDLAQNILLKCPSSGRPEECTPEESAEG